MKTVIEKIRNVIFILFGLVLTPGAVLADAGKGHRHAGGLSIYMGMIPTELIQEREIPREAKMHGGIPQGKNRYHFVVALFNDSTGERITNMKVSAKLSGIDLSTKTKSMERMEVNGMVTFGNYFSIDKKTPFKIRLKLESLDKVVTNTVFEFDRPVR